MVIWGDGEAAQRVTRSVLRAVWQGGSAAGGSAAFLRAAGVVAQRVTRSGCGSAALLRATGIGGPLATKKQT